MSRAAAPLRAPTPAPAQDAPGAAAARAPAAVASWPRRAAPAAAAGPFPAALRSRPPTPPRFPGAPGPRPRGRPCVPRGPLAASSRPSPAPAAGLAPGELQEGVAAARSLRCPVPPASWVLGPGTAAQPGVSGPEREHRRSPAPPRLVLTAVSAPAGWSYTGVLGSVLRGTRRSSSDGRERLPALVRTAPLAGPGH